MKQTSLPIDTTNLFEVVCHEQTLSRAFQSVKRNKGAAGIDNVSVEDFDKIKTKELAQLKQELINWDYKPMPVRRVEIPKPNNNGVRLLGVPTVRDRVLQTAIKMVIEPILDPMFSDSSFGFRPERNQRQAIETAKSIIASGKEYVVDIDLSKFFDRINHDRLIALLAKHIDDKRILRLIGLTLRSGVMTDQGFQASTLGSTQGSPLSPLLSNVILDVLDKKLEQRALSFVRFADDCNIFVATVKAAERVMENITAFIENRMKLVVNSDKSQVAKSNKVKFLGVTIVNGTVAIAKQSMSNAKEKIKELLPRGTHKTLDQTVQGFNQWFIGWVNYFNVTQYPAQIKAIEAKARRRLRVRFIAQCKRRKFLFKQLKKRGVRPKTAARIAFSNKKRWALSRSKAVENALPNAYFDKAGLATYSNNKLQHWFPVSRWVHLT